jgi:hypothetical protein
MRPAVLALTLAVAACTPVSPPAPQAGPAPAASPVAPPNDDRDQYALLAAVETARGHGLVAEPAALAAVRSDWQGKRVRWTLGFVPVLCPATGACTVLPFDHGRREDRIVQGWLPRLAIDADARRELAERCGPHERTCVVTVEATLRELTLSNDEPTSLTLADVAVHDTRSSRDGESWIRRRPRQG